MYKVEIKELGESKVSLCKIIPHIDYKDLYNLVKHIQIKYTYLSPFRIIALTAKNGEIYMHLDKSLAK